MPTLYETIRIWREAQVKLSRQTAASQAAHQVIVDRLVTRLQRHRSLADLAISYYRDGDWWLPVVGEFSLDSGSLDADLIHDSAYFQRFLQLRQPSPRIR